MRKSPRAIRINPNLRCARIYPIENTKKSVQELKTVGIKLTREQAIELSRVLLAVTQDWAEIELTGYRFERRKGDGTYHLTVTSMHEDHE